MPIKGGKAGSIKALRASVERKGGGNDAFLQRIPGDDSIMVRFLTEPEEWQSYFEHYDQVMKYYPCSDNCPGCSEGNKPSQKYLANVLDIKGDRVVPMVLPKSMVTKLLNSYDRYDTLMDRDYELIRLGSGLDTDYDRSAEPPSKRPTKHLTQLNLEEVLENQLSRAFDDDKDDEPKPTRAASRPGAKAKAVEVEEESGTELLDRSELEDMSLRELRAYAKNEAGIAASDIRGLDQDALVELILGRAEDAEEEDEEEPYDADAEDAPEENPEEDDSEELTEDEIRAMTLQQLRKLCGQMEIPWKRTDGKALLVKKVIEAATVVGDDEPPF